MKLRFLFLTLLAGFSCLLPVAGVKAEPEEPKVALVLSGGGARGFAHVGVLKVLQELGVKVDIVTGTSMGAMVGGGYASGYSAQDIENIIESVDWREMFALRPKREMLSWRSREDDYKNFALDGLGLSSEGITFPDAMIPSQNLALFLNRVTEHVSTVDDLSQLSIPFACIGTDLGDGTAVVLQKHISLAKAMRASMSIPGAYAPVRYNDRVLVDGGLAQNLPVETARAMGADIIIAVNVGTPVGDPEKVRSAFGVLGQMVGILTERNIVESKAALREGDILITPDLDEFTSADFGKSKAIIAAGEKAARAYTQQLKKLATNRESYDQWQAWRQMATIKTKGLNLTEIKVEGLERVSPEKVLYKAGVPLDTPITQAQAEEASTRIWAMEHFSSVPYEIERGPSGSQVLVFKPKETPWSFNTLKMGGKIGTDFQDDHSFQFVLAHTLSWLNDWGGEWRNEARIGKDGYFTTSLYQPIGAASPFFIQPEMTWENQRYDWYNGRKYAQARIRNELMEGLFYSGVELGDYGLLRGGLGWAHVKSKPAEGVLEKNVSDSYSTLLAKVSLKIDTLDNVAFPTEGMSLYLQGAHFAKTPYDKGSGTDYYGELSVPLTYDKTTLLTTIRAGQSSLQGRFVQGGLFNLSGSAYGRYVGNHMLFARVLAYQNIGRTHTLDIPLYLGVSLEAARVRTRNGIHWELVGRDDEKWKGAGSLFIGMDSFLGPMYWAVGHTHGGETSAYFYWGIPY